MRERERDGKRERYWDVEREREKVNGDGEKRDPQRGRLKVKRTVLSMFVSSLYCNLTLLQIKFTVRFPVNVIIVYHCFHFKANS